MALFSWMFLFRLFRLWDRTSVLSFSASSSSSLYCCSFLARLPLRLCDGASPLTAVLHFSSCSFCLVEDALLIGNLRNNNYLKNKFCMNDYFYFWNYLCQTLEQLRGSSSFVGRPPPHQNRSRCPRHCPPNPPPLKKEHSGYFGWTTMTIFIQILEFNTFFCLLKLNWSSSSSLKPSNSSSESDWLNRWASSAVINLDLKHGACLKEIAVLVQVRAR